MSTVLARILDAPSTVLIAGFGVSGRGCLRLLREHVATVYVCDTQSVLSSTIEEQGGVYVHPDDARELIATLDLVVTSPGWRPDTPLLLAAARDGIPVFTDLDVAFFCDQRGLRSTPSTWLAITGTNGKTTTTEMVADIMERHSGSAQAMGNIGLALCDGINRYRYVVAELSSFQLHWSHDFVPTCGCLLNVADDHLDWHGGFDAYAAAKARILTGATSVVGVDDPTVRRLATHAAGRVIGFTAGEPAPGQVGVSDGWIVDRTAGHHQSGDGSGRIMRVAQVSAPGAAGLLDALAATAVARSQDVPAETIAAALSEFSLAKHRGQVVYEWDAATCIDNSKATNPHAADAALAGLENVIWVAGGQLKGADVEELVATHAPQMTAVALLGTDAQIIADAVRRHRPEIPLFMTRETDPHVAMDAVCDFVVSQVNSEYRSTIVLAPAAASLDMYTGMSQRGELFAQSMRRAHRNHETTSPDEDNRRNETRT